MEAVKNYVDVRKLVYSALFVIGALVLPKLFHMAGWEGPTFLPMNIPVILAGFILGKKYGLLTGVSAPVISTLVSGMPAAFPVLPIMILQFGTYGFASGYLSKETKLPAAAEVLATMVLGWIAYAVGFYGLLFTIAPQIAGSLSPISAIITGIPGIIISMVALPLVVKVLKDKRS